MTEALPQTTSGVPAPLSANRPAIEITVRLDPGLFAEPAGSGVRLTAEIDFAPGADPAIALLIDPPTVPPELELPRKAEQDSPVHPLIALGLAMSLAAAAGVVVDWQTAVTVLVIVLELFVVFGDSR